MALPKVKHFIPPNFPSFLNDSPASLPHPHTTYTLTHLLLYSHPSCFRECHVEATIGWLTATTRPQRVYTFRN